VRFEPWGKLICSLHSQNFVCGGDDFSLWAEKLAHRSDQGSNSEPSEGESGILLEVTRSPWLRSGCNLKLNLTHHGMKK
jgi:hypothetical protein